MKKIFFFITISLLKYGSYFAQQIKTETTAEVLGIITSNNQNPFWLQANTNTQVGEFTNFSTQLGFTAQYSISENAEITFGSSFFYRDGVAKQLQRNQLYLEYKNKWLKATLGAKNDSIVANNLSTSNKNFLFSNNARALPGVLLESSKALKLNTTFSIDWAIGQYYFNDERFVENTMLHYKKLALNIQFSENKKLITQLQHAVQWGGNSPVFGALRNDFNAFVDVFFASKATEINVEGEILNAVGNHLGTYYIEYVANYPWGQFNLYHEHPFEDGSGTALKNLSDGIWGVNFTLPENKFINTLVYEFVTTKDQSGPNRPDGYFSNNIYRSGWSYDGSIIGFPFITFDDNLEVTPLNSPISSNRVQLHHFGFSGTLNKVIWNIKSSFFSSFGTYRNPLQETLNASYNYLDLQYKNLKWGNFKTTFGVDASNLFKTRFGVAVGYQYIF